MQVLVWKLWLALLGTVVLAVSLYEIFKDTHEEAYDTTTSPIVFQTSTSKIHGEGHSKVSSMKMSSLKTIAQEALRTGVPVKLGLAIFGALLVLAVALGVVLTQSRSYVPNPDEVVPLDDKYQENQLDSDSADEDQSRSITTKIIIVGLLLVAFVITVKLWNSKQTTQPTPAQSEQDDSSSSDTGTNAPPETLKLIAIYGGKGVGKYSLACRFKQNSCLRPKKDSIPDYILLRQPEKNTRIQVWYGNNYRVNLAPNTDFAIFVYDITNIDSYFKIPTLAQQAASVPTVRKILVGNKCDCADRKISVVQGQKMQQLIGAEFFVEISAINDFNVQKLIDHVTN